ncbi:MAG: CxxxxCH/CxxCH domain-containing protein [Anaerolineae bacterium]
MLTKRFATFILVLLALGLALGYQAAWSQPAVDPPLPAPLAVVENPHGGFGPGTQRCLTCHNIHASRQALSDALCEQCHAIPTHMEQSCLDCHDPHGQTDNLTLIREMVNTQPVVFRQKTGKGSLSEGADDPDALCVACHTKTRFHRRDAPESHFEGQDCTRCHQHRYGFWPENIQCYECHSTPPPSGDHMTHANAPYGPVIHATCETCHWQVTTWKVHRDGRVEFADRKPLAETSACDTCHGTPAGVEQAKALWGSEDRVDCVTCHNGEHPAQINGATAPATFEFWTTSGHGNAAGFVSGNPGAGLACETCHDPDAPHIGAADGNKRLRDEPTALCISCHGAGGSASVKVSTHGNTHFGFRFQGQFQVDCTECHNPHGTGNLSMIRSEIRGDLITFTARTGAGSFDTPDNDNRNDLCARCHTQTRHNRVPSNQTETRHFEGADCTNCHKHDRDDRPETVDGFVLGDIGCSFCHGQPPPPANSGYPLDEAKTPHQIHAAGSGYGFGCERCHDTGNSNYAGHRTDPPSFQDVWFNNFNPDGQYDATIRACGGLYCHSNADPAGDTPIEYRPMVWAENVSLDCSGCHGDAANQTTNAHSKHLLVQYRDRGEVSIGCYECHSATAADDDNNAIANRSNHVDRVKQVAINETDLWGDAGSAGFDSASLTCATSRCHSDGAASRAFPGEPTYASPVWTDPASGACGTCHGITKETLASGIHPKHLTFATCTTCHMGYGPAHVNGQVDFADGNTLPNTNVCSQCHGSQASGQVLQTPPATSSTSTPQPTPSHTATPTPTPVPTTTETPTPTPVPTATEVPTPALAPTPTVEPAPVPAPKPLPARPGLPWPIVPITPPVPER